MSAKSSAALSSPGLKPVPIQRSRSLRAVDSPQVAQSRRKFLRFFPNAFRDETYLDWERNYKWNAHQQWNELLGFTEYRDLLQKRRFQEIASRALKVESRTNLLFSFEKMAIRDAVKAPAGAKAFATVFSSFSMDPARPRRNSKPGATLWPHFPENKLGFSPGRC